MLKFKTLSKRFLSQIQIFIWNINKESAEILAKEMKQEELPCEVVTDAESAVKNADIIVTVTTAVRPILKKDWIKEGAHINGKQKYTNVYYLLQYY